MNFGVGGQGQWDGRKQREGACPLDPHPRSTSGRDHCGDRRHGGPTAGAQKRIGCALWAIVPGSCNTAQWRGERSRQWHALRSLRQRGAMQRRTGPPAPWPRAWHTRRGRGACGRPLLSIPRRAADWTVDVTVMALFDGGGGARFDSPRVVHGDRRCHDDHRHDGDDGLQDARDAAARRPPRRSRGRRPPRGRHGRFTRRACASTPSVVRGCKRTRPQHTVRPAGMMTQPSPGGRPFLGGTIVM